MYSRGMLRVSASFEESGLGEEVWTRNSLEVTTIKSERADFDEDIETIPTNEVTIEVSLLIYAIFNNFYLLLKFF